MVTPLPPAESTKDNPDTPKLQFAGKEIRVGQLRAGLSIAYGRRVEADVDKGVPKKKKGSVFVQEA